MLVARARPVMLLGVTSSLALYPLLRSTNRLIKRLAVKKNARQKLYGRSQAVQPHRIQCSARAGAPNSLASFLHLRVSRQRLVVEAHGGFAVKAST